MIRQLSSIALVWIVFSIGCSGDFTAINLPLFSEGAPEFVLGWDLEINADIGGLGQSAIATGPLGAVYVADYGHHRVLKYNDTGKLLDSWGTLGSAEGELSGPSGIAVDRDGFVYVADSFNDRIQKFSRNGSFIMEWGAYGSGEGQFNRPADLAADGLGHLFVADPSNRRIQKFTTDGRFLRQWDDAVPISTARGGFDGIAAGLNDDVFVADQARFWVGRYSNDGEYLQSFAVYDTVISTPEEEEAEADTAIFRSVRFIDVAVRVDGRLYALDSSDDRISEFDEDGMHLSDWDDGGRLEGARRMAISPNGDLFVLRDSAGRIERYTWQVED